MTHLTALHFYNLFSHFEEQLDNVHNEMLQFFAANNHLLELENPQHKEMFNNLLQQVGAAHLAALEATKQSTILKLTERENERTSQLL